MTKKEKREIRVEYFKIEGFPYSITFTPQEDNNSLSNFKRTNN
jgi:hypothetical protein